MNCPDCGKFTKKQVWDHPPIPAYVVWWCNSCGWGYADVEERISALPPDAFNDIPINEREQKMKDISELDVVDIPVILEKCVYGRRH